MDLPSDSRCALIVHPTWDVIIPAGQTIESSGHSQDFRGLGVVDLDYNRTSSLFPSPHSLATFPLMRLPIYFCSRESPRR